MNPQIIIKSLALLTLFSNIGVVLILILFLVSRQTGGKNIRKVIRLIKDKSLSIAFLVALTATGGSLYFSEVAGFTPCMLCWYQRIFMYPLVVILGIAIWKKTRDVGHYVLPLSIIGGLMAFYHYKIQISPDSLLPCSAVGFSVSCSERFFTYFGYITIPWMSFSAFLLIFLMMLFVMQNERK